jgi:hypothetical protein
MSVGVMKVFVSCETMKSDLNKRPSIGGLFLIDKVRAK